MKNLTALVAVATFATCNFTVARADTTSEPRSVTVHFEDLDTTNASGAAVLAETVCRDLDPGRSLALISLHANCMHVALSNAVAKIDRPAVTAYAVARGVLPRDATTKLARNR